LVPSEPGCGVIDLATAPGYLYWTSFAHGQVRRLTLASGVIETLSSAEAGPSQIAVVGDVAYWVNTMTNTLRKVVAGAPVSDVVSAPGGIGGFVALPDGTVYFGTGQTVRKLPPGGQAAVDVAQTVGEGKPNVQGNQLASIEAESGRVRLVALVDGVVAQCVTRRDYDPGPDPSVNCRALNQEGHDIILDEIVFQGPTVVWGDQEIWTAAADVVTPLVALASTRSGGDVRTLAATADMLYASDGTEILRVPLGASSAQMTALARGQTNVTSTAVDDARVYWSDLFCEIEATAR
jgi:hypothetical protein